MKINKNIYILKRIRIVYFLIGGLLALASCSQDFGDINKSWENELYVANEKGLTNDLISRLVPTGHHLRITTSWLYQWNQSAAIYSASGYRLDDHTTNPWEQFYTGLANSIVAQDLIAKKDNPDNYKNISAIIKILVAEKALESTMLYGDMPFTEAGKGFLGADYYRPAYDPQKTVFTKSLEDLTWAVNNLSTTDSSQETLGSSDTLFQNDIDMWIKFANSLRLKYAMAMREKDPATADAVIADALNKPLLSPDETVELGTNNVQDLEIKRDPFFRGNAYVRMGSTMWNEMSSSNAVDGSGIYDLRCKIFFEPNENDEWVPYPQNPTPTTPTVTGDPYKRERLDDYNSNRSNFASINVFYVNDRTVPHIVISGSEISFIKAELYNRGIAGVAANPAQAEANYKAGITASVKYWYGIASNSPIWNVNQPSAAPTNAELTAMLNNPNVAYDADPTVALKQIYKQWWISLFHQPFASWDLQRRTNNGTPFVPLTTSLVNDFNRLTYPPSERETNRENWTTATGGADSETKKIWIQQ